MITDFILGTLFEDIVNERNKSSHIYVDRCKKTFRFVFLVVLLNFKSFGKQHFNDKKNDDMASKDLA
jgi:hypothetical protein